MTPDRRDPTKGGGTLSDLDRQVAKSDAFRFHNLFENSAQSWEIVRANAVELEAELKPFDDPSSFQLWALDDYDARPALDAAIVVVVRRLHNFLGSAIAVVEYTKRSVVFHRKRRPDFVREHKTRITTLYQSPVFAFMKFLRNHTLHAGRHVVGASFPLSARSTPRVFLSKRPVQVAVGELRDAIIASAYLKTAPDRIDLRTLMQEYLEAVRGFLNWYHAEQVAAYEDAKQEIEPIVKEIESRRTRRQP